jgi:hypothetical protein
MKHKTDSAQLNTAQVSSRMNEQLFFSLPLRADFLRDLMLVLVAKTVS